MNPSSLSTAAPALPRGSAGFLAAVLLHGTVLLALCQGFLATTPSVPPEGREVSVSLVNPTPAPRPEPVQRKTPVTEQARPRPAPVPAPSPRPVMAAPADAPSPVAVPAAPASAPAPAPAAVSRAETPAVAPPRFDAAYLSNPAPAYPPISRRTGEQGKVMLRVEVSAEGSPLSVEIQTSSGFARLDEAARNAVRRWRFVPAQRNGKPVAESVIVPIDFKLN